MRSELRKKKGKTFNLGFLKSITILSWTLCLALMSLAGTKILINAIIMANLYKKNWVCVGSKLNYHH
jgi:hypothetical protein